MTDKLIMTTADRDYFLKCIKTLCIGSHSDSTRTAQTLQAMLQSLPMVDSEPVARQYLTRFKHVTGWTTEPEFNAEIFKTRELYTSPQALTPITADDVTDEMVDAVEDDAIAEALAAKKDAERYQALRRGQKWSVIDGIGDTLRAEGLDEAIDSAATCVYCDGTGDVHSMDGEWRGVCTECVQSPAIQAKGKA